MDEGEEKEGIEMGGEEEEEEEEEVEDEDYLKAITNESRAARDSLTILAAKLDDKEDKKAQAAKKPKGPEIKENESNDNDDKKQRMDMSDESGKRIRKLSECTKTPRMIRRTTRQGKLSSPLGQDTNTFSQKTSPTHPTHLKFHELWTSINLSWFANQYYLGSIQSTHESSNFSTLKGDVFAPEIAQEKAEACRKNAWVAQTVNENAISRLWVLLSVSINSMRSDNIDDSPMAVASITNGSKSWMSSAIETIFAKDHEIFTANRRYSNSCYHYMYIGRM